ncbi:ABC transporter ATP-binding protein [Rhizobium rhizoryzae]|jgi:peptide/nickel transport system ATP-binding protein/oligopeptide transport system ATP-binding protein|uniref:Peptide/nickel transport system ATP-binding protein/oligopeptide transport system ATP-binding protein n=1 Tax=Rhizobium rhizoryzae TaxID=451876 RepID=A0A7W6LJD7_9HYPH|nr:oligopeptide/dipeptide ABC transporter ATP-binding protein [Rhizobium rhizoryzae]MBB4145458.1 peptide/nickel transport system ATP-binding protein/oligopeptide transport system ATP-binding protein [Rhizobium rhizoryzae]
MTADTNVLRAENLVRHFKTGKGQTVHAVNDVSLSIAPGETLALVGESGCGKSTLGRMIMGLDRPDKGSVKLLGQDLSGMGRRELHEARRSVQMIFQDPSASLDPRWTAEAIVREPLDNFRIGTSAERREQVLQLLGKVGLRSDQAKRYPHELSGGQRQRLGIARALATRPRLVVADEPVSALDVSIRAQVINLLCDLRDEMELSLLFISHDIGVVSHISKRIAVMYLGRIVEAGETSVVLNAPQHPYTVGLLQSVPRPRPAERRQRAPLEGDPPSPINLPSGCAFRTRCPLAVDLCASVVPPLRSIAPGRFSACHRAEEMTNKELLNV